MKYILSSIFLFSVLFVSIANSQEEHNFKPEAGYVSDAKTAISIAEAVLSSIYGEDTILKERPFKANLENNVWTVEGALHCGPKAEYCKGGVAIIEISKDDGRILRVSHGK